MYTSPSRTCGSCLAHWNGKSWEESFSNVVGLKTWTLLLNDKFELCVKGQFDKNDSENKIIFCFVIYSRIKSFWLVSDQTLVKLLGAFDTRDVPEFIAKKFSTGFPLNWKEFAKKWAQSIQQGPHDSFNCSGFSSTEISSESSVFSKKKCTSGKIVSTNINEQSEQRILTKTLGRKQLHKDNALPSKASISDQKAPSSPLQNVWLPEYKIQAINEWISSSKNVEYSKSDLQLHIEEQDTCLQSECAKSETVEEVNKICNIVNSTPLSKTNQLADILDFNVCSVSTMSQVSEGSQGFVKPLDAPNEKKAPAKLGRKNLLPALSEESFSRKSQTQSREQSETNFDVTQSENTSRNCSPVHIENTLLPSEKSVTKSQSTETEESRRVLAGVNKLSRKSSKVTDLKTSRTLLQRQLSSSRSQKRSSQKIERWRPVLGVDGTLKLQGYLSLGGGITARQILTTNEVKEWNCGKVRTCDGREYELVGKPQEKIPDDLKEKLLKPITCAEIIEKLNEGSKVKEDVSSYAYLAPPPVPTKVCLTRSGRVSRPRAPHWLNATHWGAEYDYFFGETGVDNKSRLNPFSEKYQHFTSKGNSEVQVSDSVSNPSTINRSPVLGENPLSKPSSTSILGSEHFPGKHPASSYSQSPFIIRRRNREQRKRLRTKRSSSSSDENDKPGIDHIKNRKSSLFEQNTPQSSLKDVQNINLDQRMMSRLNLPSNFATVDFSPTRIKVSYITNSPDARHVSVQQNELSTTKCRRELPIKMSDSQVVQQSHLHMNGNYLSSSEDKFRPLETIPHPIEHTGAKRRHSSRTLVKNVNERATDLTMDYTMKPEQRKPDFKLAKKEHSLSSWASKESLSSIRHSLKQPSDVTFVKPETPKGKSQLDEAQNEILSPKSNSVEESDDEIFPISIISKSTTLVNDTSKCPLAKCLPHKSIPVHIAETPTDEKTVVNNGNMSSRGNNTWLSFKIGKKSEENEKLRANSKMNTHNKISNEIPKAEVGKTGANARKNIVEKTNPRKRGQRTLKKSSLEKTSKDTHSVESVERTESKVKNIMFPSELNVDAGPGKKLDVKIPTETSSNSPAYQNVDTIDISKNICLQDAKVVVPRLETSRNQLKTDKDLESVKSLKKTNVNRKKSTNTTPENTFTPPQTRSSKQNVITKHKQIATKRDDEILSRKNEVESEKCKEIQEDNIKNTASVCSKTSDAAIGPSASVVVNNVADWGVEYDYFNDKASVGNNTRLNPFSEKYQHFTSKGNSEVQVSDSVSNPSTINRSPVLGENPLSKPSSTSILGSEHFPGKHPASSYSQSPFIIRRRNREQRKLMRKKFNFSSSDENDKPGIDHIKNRKSSLFEQNTPQSSLKDVPNINLDQRMMSSLNLPSNFANVDFSPTRIKVSYIANSPDARNISVQQNELGTPKCRRELPNKISESQVIHPVQQSHLDIEGNYLSSCTDKFRPLETIPHPVEHSGSKRRRSSRTLVKDVNEKASDLIMNYTMKPEQSKVVFQLAKKGNSLHSLSSNESLSGIRYSQISDKRFVKPETPKRKSQLDEVQNEILSLKPNFVKESDDTFCVSEMSRRKIPLNDTSKSAFAKKSKCLAHESIPVHIAETPTDEKTVIDDGNMSLHGNNTRLSREKGKKSEANEKSRANSKINSFNDIPNDIPTPEVVGKTGATTRKSIVEESNLLKRSQRTLRKSSLEKTSNEACSLESVVRTGSNVKSKISCSALKCNETPRTISDQKFSEKSGNSPSYESKDYSKIVQNMKLPEVRVVLTRLKTVKDHSKMEENLKSVKSLKKTSVKTKKIPRMSLKKTNVNTKKISRMSLKKTNVNPKKIPKISFKKRDRHPLQKTGSSKKDVTKCRRVATKRKDAILRRKKEVESDRCKGIQEENINDAASVCSEASDMSIGPSVSLVYNQLSTNLKHPPNTLKERRERNRQLTKMKDMLQERIDLPDDDDPLAHLLAANTFGTIPQEWCKHENVSRLGRKHRRASSSDGTLSPHSGLGDAFECDVNDATSSVATPRLLMKLPNEQQVESYLQRQRVLYAKAKRAQRTVTPEKVFVPRSIDYAAAFQSDKSDSEDSMTSDSS